MATVEQLLAESTALAGDEAQREAQVLLCAALKKPRSYLVAWPDAEVEASAAEHYRHLLAQRASGIPVAYLLGEREFWSLTLRVNDATLIPRPDTELLVEQALKLDLSPGASVLDLGTGSGAIALALASERPRWQITGVEHSPEALEIARTNGKRLGLKDVAFHRSDWFTAVRGQRFDLIVSNPPYIAESDGHLSSGDLRFEPRSALVSGADGLDDIRHIIAEAPTWLEPRGRLLLEHGFEQGSTVRALLSTRGFTAVASAEDLAGHERVSSGVWQGEGLC
ncbi:peptide chain release factor N(5)-glutamine methyltransferase [Congregibacter litoralis]|uniref:Release factor glutamine methyltransferase n=1 Tax=Congregibacter litoralis KT71 TaxID=314285 RepID=A4A5A2_9GAMM|nr:peptide chain release factor N(5)-glutamine methyltransferase [Congregibacter litoralis]EAQ98973.1 [protein release factor]-glutamine N5-methyltransferase [Congregibacter litoralis KT71]